MSLKVYGLKSTRPWPKEAFQSYKLIKNLEREYEDKNNIRLALFPLTGKKDVEIDFIIFSECFIAVGDFKYAEGVNLRGTKNGRWVYYVGSREQELKGGAQENPYRQLTKNREYLTKVMQKCKKKIEMKSSSFGAISESICRILLLEGPMTLHDDTVQFLNETGNFVIITFDKLGKLFALINTSKPDYPFVKKFSSNELDLFIKALGFDPNDYLDFSSEDIETRNLESAMLIEVLSKLYSYLLVRGIKDYKRELYNFRV